MRFHIGNRSRKMEKPVKELLTLVERVDQKSPLYQRIFKDAGVVAADVKTMGDFENLPFSEKDDLRKVYPLGLQSVPDEEVVRIHSSSGTTGDPVIIPYTAQDVTDWAIMFERSYRYAGMTNKDRIQITPGYGLWTAGIGFQAGAERLGAMVIPMGPGNTPKQIKMMQDLQSTVIACTSSYAIVLAEEAPVSPSIAISIVACIIGTIIFTWKSSTPSPCGPCQRVSMGKWSSPPLERKGHHFCVTAPMTSAESSPANVPADQRSPATTESSAEPMTWSR